jgi:hypothetical protein
MTAAVPAVQVANQIGMGRADPPSVEAAALAATLGMAETVLMYILAEAKAEQEALAAAGGMGIRVAA